MLDREASMPTFEYDRISNPLGGPRLDHMLARFFVTSCSRGWRPKSTNCERPSEYQFGISRKGEFRLLSYACCADHFAEILIDIYHVTGIPIPDIWFAEIKPRTSIRQPEEPTGHVGSARYGDPLFHRWLNREPF